MRLIVCLIRHEYRGLESIPHSLNNEVARSANGEVRNVEMIWDDVT
jgi:hypothetical protein